ncbi:hypothetical protein D3C72_1890690 [compost metagenome]
MGVNRHHRQAHSEPHHAQTQHNMRQTGIYRNSRQQEQTTGNDDQSDKSQRPGTDFVEQSTAERHPDARSQRLRQKDKSGLKRRIAAHLLQVQRHEQHGAEQGSLCNPGQQNASGEMRGAEDAKLQQRIFLH